MPRTVLLTTLLLAGCLGVGEDESLAERAWQLDRCQATLHVWLVPLSELASRTPAEFPPAIFREQGVVPTPMGRVVFYLYDCEDTLVDGDDEGRSLLGLLGVRVEPPSTVAPPTEQPDWASTPWVSVYLLDSVSAGHAADLLDDAGLPTAFMVGRVHVTPTDLPDAPTALAELEDDGLRVFTGSMQGAPGQVEAFNRPERYFHASGEGDRDVTWLDVRFNSTLWETEGRVNYAAGSPWDEAVGNRAYDVGVDHHAMRSTLELSVGRGSL